MGITGLGGVGIRPTLVNGGVRNVILQQWTVYPPEIGYYPDVQFDLTRRKERRIIKYYDDLGGTTTSGAFPDLLDKANDDSINVDEYGPNPLDHMFVWDMPGYELNVPKPDEPNLITFYQHLNMQEFVRVWLNGLHPSGDTLEGSRASAKFDWHSRMLVHNTGPGGTWARDPMAGSNTIGEGHQPL